MIKIILLVIVVLIAVVLIIAATRPNDMHIERSASIKAPADRIFPFINDFHSWSYWSPYEKLDPQMKRTYSGSTNGKGAVYEWQGNSKAGKGRMEILETSQPAKITIKLDFFAPMEGHNIATFTLVPNGDSTNITWAMDGPASFMAKVAGIFMNMDELIGKDFAVGLANLKAVAEK